MTRSACVLCCLSASNNQRKCDTSGVFLFKNLREKQMLSRFGDIYSNNDRTLHLKCFKNYIPCMFNGSCSKGHYWCDAWHK